MFGDILPKINKTDDLANFKPKNTAGTLAIILTTNIFCDKFLQHVQDKFTIKITV